MTKDEQWLLDEKYGGEKTSQYEADKERLLRNEPVAYVIGWQPFLGLKIYLDSRPLIPRPETEWWVEQMLKKIPTCSTFLDLCSGSGAIGCAALKKLPNAEIYFGEIDSKHEATIQKNIHENKLDESRSHIRIGDLFEPFGDMRFDMIAINPPYIPTDRVLQASVANHEPSLALFAGVDGLDLIRRIATALPEHLNANGVAWIEIDSDYAEASKELFTQQGFAVEIRNDQYGKPRVLVVSFS